MNELKASRLLLRALRDEDAEQIRTLRSHPEVNKYIGRPNEFSLQESLAFIKKIQQANAEERSFYWAICPLTQNKLTGTICVWNFSEDKKEAEIGFELLPEWQGKGLVSEAVKEVIEYCFSNSSLEILWGATSPENLASIRVLEKFGFVYDAEKKENDLRFYRLEKRK